MYEISYARLFGIADFFYGSGNRDDKTTELQRKHLKGFSCKIYSHYAKYTETLTVTDKQLTKLKYETCIIK